MDTAWIFTLLLSLLISGLLIFSTWNQMYRKRNLPPGPTPVPLFGNILQINRGEMVKSLLELGKKYGPVYTLYFGPSPVVVLCGYKEIKEALINQAEEFSGRGRLPTLDQYFKGFGLSFSNGERWRQLRRYSLTTLKNFGMGKRSIEERIQEEAQFLVAEFKSYKERPFEPSHIFIQAVSNVICSIMFGKRYDYDNENIRNMVCMFQAVFLEMSSAWGQLMDLFPVIMNHVPGPHKKILKHMNRVHDFILKRIEENKKTLDINSPRHFIDSFLIKMQQDNKNPSSVFCKENLLPTIMNIFFAGTETVSTTLRHALLILLVHPEVESKLQEEIDRVIGPIRSPKIEDRTKMPYTDAVIHEIQRVSDVLPMNLPHSVIKDTVFRGYNIPKGTGVYPLLCAALRDPEQFATPNKFNPNHFLDENGCFRKNDAFMPFSTGKRLCIGEALARMELFLFLTSILQKFKLHSESHFTEEAIEPKMQGFANYPLSYQLSLVPR